MAGGTHMKRPVIVTGFKCSLPLEARVGGYQIKCPVIVLGIQHFLPIKAWGGGHRNSKYIEIFG